jgi:hypothetical protein
MLEQIQIDENQTFRVPQAFLMFGFRVLPVL